MPHLFLFLLDVFTTLIFIAWIEVSELQRNLAQYALKGLVALSAATPGFASFLESGVDLKDVSVSSVPAVLRSVASNPFARFALPKLAAFDVLEVDDAGRLHSLLWPDSPYEGRLPNEMRSVLDRIPILLIDRPTAADIDTPGPILLTADASGAVRSDAMILLGGARTWDTRRLRAPFLIKDGVGRVVNVGSTSSVIDFVDLVNGARTPLRKALNGEPLFAKVDPRETPPPKRLSLLKFGLTRTTCRIGWFAVACRWKLKTRDLQVVADQMINREAPVLHAVSVARVKFLVTMTNARVAVDGGKVKVTFDLNVGAAPDQGPLTSLFANPARLTDVTAEVEELRYDRARGVLEFARPVVTDFGPTVALDPGLLDITRIASNLALTRAFGSGPSYDLRAKSTLGSRLLRSIEVADDEIKVRAGVGRCDTLLLD